MRRMYSLEQLKNLIKQRIESGEIENAKPIYYHGIYFNGSNADNSENCQINFMILNNSATPFTVETFKQYIKALMDEGAYIQANGYVFTNSHTHDVFLCLKISSAYKIAYRTDSGASDLDIETYTTINTFNDGVNKIN